MNEFETLGTLVRLRRQERKLTQDELADLAGISRGQIALIEGGRNFSLAYLVKVANVLELTDIALEGLRLHASPPELASIVRAFDAVTNAERAMARIEAARAELSDASATLKALLDRTLSSPGPMNEIGEAARRIEKRAPAERHRIGAGLRELASGKTRRPKAEATETATRKRAR